MDDAIAIGGFGDLGEGGGLGGDGGSHICGVVKFLLVCLFEGNKCKVVAGIEE